MQTYEQINAGFNRQMLGGQRNRVKFLRRILARLGNPDWDNVRTGVAKCWLPGRLF